MKEALKNLSKIIGEFGDRIQEAMKDFELPVVWAEMHDNGSGGKYICPNCSDVSHFAWSSDREKDLTKHGESRAHCIFCCTHFFIRIRPDDPVEDYPEGWEGFAVYQDENYCIKPSIFKASIRTHGMNRAIYLDRNDLENRERAITLKDYLKGGFALDYISLHRTYAEALTVAAGLWEKEGTELSYVFFSRRDEKYILREFRFRDSKAEYNDSVEGWTRDRNEYLTDICAYIGPDRELAEKICAEKNAEMKPEVDDSVLDKVITTSELVSMTEAYPLSPMMVWIWGITDPTWDELLGRKPAWAQWVVDNLAGDVDAKVIAALKARLAGSK